MVILVVEDQALVRFMIVDTLEEQGFAVVEAANAEEAVKLFDEHPVWLVVSDIDMGPGMNGIELAHRIRTRDERTGILLVSGRQIPARDELPDRTLFMTKPFLGEVLISTVRAMLGGGPGDAARRA